MGVIVASFRLALARETMFPSRAPFFKDRLGARRAHVTAPPEEHERGNLPVSPNPFHAITPQFAARTGFGWA
jgi:hypothetical protein